MGDTTTSYTNAAKEIYEDQDVLQQQQNMSAPFFAKIKKSKQVPSIEGVFNAVITEGDETGGAINENESFPTPLPTTIERPSVVSKTCVYPLEISKKLMALAQNNKQAFAEAYDTKVMDVRDRAIRDMNRQSYGTGTGQITLANGAGVATTSLVVDDSFPFFAGMYIDAFATIGGAKEIANIKITAVDRSTNTLTLASAQSWSDNAIICKAFKMDGVTGQSDAKEFMGWRGIADDGTFGTFEGVNPTTVTDWKAQVVSASNAPVSEDLLQKLFNRIAVQSGKKPSTLISNYGQHRVFKNTELNKVRYEPAEIKAGATVLKWGDLEWIVDSTAPAAEVAMMSMNGIRRFEVYNLRLSDVGNGQTEYQVYGRHQVGSYFEYEGNIGVWRRNDQGRLTNLQEPAY